MKYAGIRAGFVLDNRMVLILLFESKLKLQSQKFAFSHIFQINLTVANAKLYQRSVDLIKLLTNAKTNVSDNVIVKL